LIKELWAIHAKGNKQTASLRLTKIVKTVEFEYLKSRLLAYVKHCTEQNIFMKGLDVWLNPIKKHWDDPLFDQKAKEVITRQTTVKFIK